VTRENIWAGPFKKGKCVLCGANDLQGCLRNRETHWAMRGAGVEAAKRRKRAEREKLAEETTNDG
jgi:hypothetical protein